MPPLARKILNHCDLHPDDFEKILSALRKLPQQPGRSEFVFTKQPPSEKPPGSFVRRLEGEYPFQFHFEDLEDTTRLLQETSQSEVDRRKATGLNYMGVVIVPKFPPFRLGTPHEFASDLQFPFQTSKNAKLNATPLAPPVTTAANRLQLVQILDRMLTKARLDNPGISDTELVFRFLGIRFLDSDPASHLARYTSSPESPE
jgi:hypothetical protein